jgi:hypothetical protein
LGVFAGDPRGALKRAASRPDLRQALLMVALAALARALAEALAQGVPSDAVGARFAGRAVASAAAAWVCAAAVWHGASRLLGREGSFKALLCMLGWAAGVYALALPVALAARVLAAPLWVAGLWTLAVETAFLLLAWWCLREVYGWSGGRAFLVLIAPPAALFLAAAAIGALFAASFLGGAVFSKFFL